MDDLEAIVLKAQSEIASNCECDKEQIEYYIYSLVIKWRIEGESTNERLFASLRNFREKWMDSLSELVAMSPTPFAFWDNLIADMIDYTLMKLVDGRVPIEQMVEELAVLVQRCYSSHDSKPAMIAIWKAFRGMASAVADRICEFTPEIVSIKKYVIVECFKAAGMPMAEAEEKTNVALQDRGNEFLAGIQLNCLRRILCLGNSIEDLWDYAMLLVIHTRRTAESHLGTGTSGLVPHRDTCHIWDNPPKRDECPICMAPFPLDDSMLHFLSCCGTTVCKGCDFSYKLSVFKENLRRKDSAKSTLEKKCPFCRAPPCKGNVEDKNRMFALVRKGNARAMAQLGMFIINLDCSNDCLVRGTRLFQFAADRGEPTALYELGQSYLGKGGLKVDEDLAKGKQYLRLSAMFGNAHARHNLGCLSYDRGEKEDAVAHWILSTEAGLKSSADKLIKCQSEGLIHREFLEEILRDMQAVCDEWETDERKSWNLALAVREFQNSSLARNSNVNLE